MPYLPDKRPYGLGHDVFEHWTLSGEAINEVMTGTVFIDGSCYKEGPPTWHRTGWAVVKMTPDGIIRG